MNASAYWEECIVTAADECGLVMTAEQLSELVSAVKGGHENYGMAFYSPPASDRYRDLEYEWKRKYAALQAELDKYRCDAEEAIKIALHVMPGVRVTIGEYGEVLAHGGRTTRIQ